MVLTPEQTADTFRFLFENGYLVQTGPDEWASTSRAEQVFMALATVLLTEAGTPQTKVGPFYLAALDSEFVSSEGPKP